MHVKFQMTDDILIASVFGELDHHSAAAVRDEIDQTMEAFQCRHLILDFEKVTFMDSSGIGMIIGRYKPMIARGGCVSASGLRPPVDRLFHLAGLHRIIAIDKTEGWEIHE